MPKVMLRWYEPGTVPVSDGRHRARRLTSHSLVPTARAPLPAWDARAWISCDCRRQGATRPSFR